MKMLLSLIAIWKETIKEIHLKKHKQFCYNSQEKLLDLSKTAGKINQKTKDLLKKFSRHAICHKYTKPKIKPIVGFNQAISFN